VGESLILYDDQWPDESQCVQFALSRNNVTATSLRFHPTCAGRGDVDRLRHPTTPHRTSSSVGPRCSSFAKIDTNSTNVVVTLADYRESDRKPLVLYPMLSRLCLNCRASKLWCARTTLAIGLCAFVSDRLAGGVYRSRRSSPGVKRDLGVCVERHVGQAERLIIHNSRNVCSGYHCVSLLFLLW